MFMNSIKNWADNVFSEGKIAINIETFPFPEDYYEACKIFVPSPADFFDKLYADIPKSSSFSRFIDMAH